jgi:hypothetical protein
VTKPGRKQTSRGRIALVAIAVAIAIWLLLGDPASPDSRQPTNLRADPVQASPSLPLAAPPGDSGPLPPREPTPLASGAPTVEEAPKPTIRRARFLSIADGTPVAGVTVRVLPKKPVAGAVAEERTSSPDGLIEFPAVSACRFEIVGGTRWELLDPDLAYSSKNALHSGRSPDNRLVDHDWEVWLADMKDLLLRVRFDGPLPDGTFPPTLSIGVRPLIAPWPLRPDAQHGMTRRRAWDLAMIRRSVPRADVIGLRVPASVGLRISVGAGGYTPAEATVDTTDSQAVASPVDLLLKRGAVATIRVVDGSGNPVKDALVGMVAKTDIPMSEFDHAAREAAFALQRAHNLGMTLGENETLGLAQLAYYMGQRKVDEAGVATVPQMGPGVAVYIRVRAAGVATVTRKLDEFERDISATITVQVPDLPLASYRLVRDGTPLRKGASISLTEEIDGMDLFHAVLSVGEGGTVVPKGVTPYQPYEAVVTPGPRMPSIIGQITFGDNRDIDVSGFE